MKNSRLLSSLLVLACAPLAHAAPKASASENEFHDPFDSSTSASKTTAAAPASSEGEFHDPFASNSSASSSKSATVSDPLEPMNRGIYHFNDKLYSWLLKPVAKGYSYIAPKPVRECVGRFFVNLKYPVRGVNNLLEGRFASAGIETSRFLINTTVGIGGFFDPAAHWNIKPRPASFDQTLATYRIPSGSYLVLPLLGPSSIRGAFGQAGDAAMNPVLYYSWFVGPEWIGYPIAGYDQINFTSLHYQEYDSLKAGTLDPYVALRSAYFENQRATQEKEK